MQQFESDYMEGMHPLILERLVATNMEKSEGYGADKYCASARKRICEACGIDNGEVHFTVGGTQTNSIIIRAMLRPHEGVIAAQSGHISVHEAGAIEAGGHKVLTLPSHDGKLWADDVVRFVEEFYNDESYEHMVFPAMVYISQPTEFGTIYSLAELEELSAVCRKYSLRLFVDGARLGYALASPVSDVTLKDLARLCDIFYIGGTKVGAMFGEAVVIPQRGLIPHLFTIIKQQGALLAKGRMLGLQFDTLFTDDLYLKIARNAIEQALRLKEALVAKGYELYSDSPTNQIFVSVDSSQMARLAAQTTFCRWCALPDGREVVRLATSWATRREDIDSLIESL